MLYHVVIAVLGTAGLLIGWVAVQNLKRHSDPHIGKSDDVLASGGCGSGQCSCGAMVSAAECTDPTCPLHQAVHQKESRPKQ